MATSRRTGLLILLTFISYIKYLICAELPSSTDPYFGYWAPFHWRLFHYNSNSMEISFHYSLYSNTVIAIQFFKWHDSCVVVACAKNVAIWWAAMKMQQGKVPSNLNRGKIVCEIGPWLACKAEYLITLWKLFPLLWNMYEIFFMHCCTSLSTILEKRMQVCEN